MKKGLFIIALFALFASFVSCSKDADEVLANGSTLEQEEVQKELKPQATAVIASAYKTGEQPQVHIVCDHEALAKYVDAKQMPEVDWALQCVVVGVVAVPNTGHTLVEPRLMEYKDGFVQEVTVSHSDEAYTALTRYTFCYVYPRLSEKSIRLKVRACCEGMKSLCEAE